MNKFNEKDIIIEEKKRVYNGFFKIDQLTFKHRRFDGDWNQDVVREVVVRDDAVAVLPYDPQLDRILFIEQLRIPLLGKAESPWTFEIIAGMIEEGEGQEEVAKREAKEEGGLEITQLIPIQNYFSSSGGSSEKMYLYLGLCDLEGAGGIYGLEEENEDIRAFTLSREEAFEILDRGELDNASTIIALMWFKLNYQNIGR